MPSCLTRDPWRCHYSDHRGGPRLCTCMSQLGTTLQGPGTKRVINVSEPKDVHLTDRLNFQKFFFMGLSVFKEQHELEH